MEGRGEMRPQRLSTSKAACLLGMRSRSLTLQRVDVGLIARTESSSFLIGLARKGGSRASQSDAQDSIV